MARNRTNSKSKAKRLAGALGVVRISHRRAVADETLVTDLSHIGPRLGRPSAAAKPKRGKKRKAK